MPVRISASTLAVAALILALLPVVLEALFSLSGKPGRWGPLTLAVLPFIAAALAAVSFLFEGSKWVSVAALLLGLVGCGVVLWLWQIKPGAWR